MEWCELGAHKVVVRWLGGIIFRQGRGIHYFLGSHFTGMHCGDLNSADKDYLRELNFNLSKGSLN